MEQGRSRTPPIVNLWVVIDFETRTWIEEKRSKAGTSLKLIPWDSGKLPRVFANVVAAEQFIDWWLHGAETVYHQSADMFGIDEYVYVGKGKEILPEREQYKGRLEIIPMRLM